MSSEKLSWWETVSCETVEWEIIELGSCRVGKLSLGKCRVGYCCGGKLSYEKLSWIPVLIRLFIVLCLCKSTVTLCMIVVHHERNF